MSRPPRHPLIPVRDGVSASCVALPQPPAGTRPWLRMLDFLAQRLPLPSPDEWAQRLARGEVLDEAGQPIPPEAPYRGGTRLYYWRTVADEPVVPFEERVLFQDAHLVVADKPHFLPVTPGGRFVRQTLLVRLKQRLGLPDLSPVHRIDRETAGLVVLSVRPQDRGAYQALFRQRTVEKVYQAIAPASAAHRFPLVRRSRIEEDAAAFFRMTEVPGAPNSETTVDAVERRGAWALYRLAPFTGKRHQLRVHMAALGLPIAGDQFYPRVHRGPDDAEDFVNPLRLLARSIAFTDPVTGDSRRFESQLALAWPD